MPSPVKGRFRERVLNTTRSLIDLRVNGVFYYPAELPGDQMQLNRVVVDMLAKAGISVILIDRDIASFPNRSEFTRIGYDNRRGGFILTEHLFGKDVGESHSSEYLRSQRRWPIVWQVIMKLIACMV